MGGTFHIMKFVIKEERITSESSFETLSVKYYQTPDNAESIALFNKKASISDFNIGDVVKIPLLLAKDTKTNFIYADTENRDNYGKDILLDKDGNFRVSNVGDFQQTQGVQNIEQSILLRLKENVDRRIRVVSYGIKKTISDPVAGNAYLLASINDTISADPRVESIDSIEYKGQGDSIIINVGYTDINGNTNQFSGVV